MNNMSKGKITYLPKQSSYPRQPWAGSSQLGVKGGGSPGGIYYTGTGWVVDEMELAKVRRTRWM
jgi:hypothetical protein